MRTIAQEQWFVSHIKIMWGFFHKSWNELVKKYLVGTRRSSHKWLSILSNRIWKIAEDAWKHKNSIEHGDDESMKEATIPIIFDSAPSMREIPVH